MIGVRTMKTRARKKVRRDLAVVAFLVLGSLGLAMVQLQVFAYPSGSTGDTVTGCDCHGSSPSSGVTVTVTGQPTEYTPATKYLLTVKVAGGPSPGGANLPTRKVKRVVKKTVVAAAKAKPLRKLKASA